MKKHIFSCLSISVFCLFTFASAQTTRYVKTIATGDASGSSWNNASGDLQLMINSLVPGDVVWVAGGIYKPIYRADNLSVLTPNDRNNAFVLKADVKIYGGFAGNEMALTQRDSTRITNNTILSGDLGTSADISDNAYHVVISAGSVGLAELNGFTIKDGNANGPGGNITVLSQSIYSSEGGGFDLTNSSPVLTNITITENSASGTGGGINNYNSSPVLSHITVVGNIAGSGGGIYNNSSSPAISNTIISGNSAVAGGGAGGGIYNLSNSFPVLTNVTISGNTASYGGGILNNNGSLSFLTNVTISGNSAISGGAIYNNLSSPKIRNSIIYGNSTGILNAGGSMPTITYSLVQDLTDESNGNISGNKDPLFVAPLSPGLSTGGNYRLKGNASPAYNKGNNNYFNAGQTPDLSAITTDLDGGARIQDGIIDLGAYEVTVSPNASAGTVTAGTTPQCIGSTTTYTVSGAILGGGTGAWRSDNAAVATVDASTGVVTAVGAGTTNIVYTVTGGGNATATASQPYTVIPNASAGTVTAGTTPQCIGSTTTYSVSNAILGGGTGAWSSDNTAVAKVDQFTGLVTAVGGGTCNIIYTVSGGCSGLQSASQPYTVISGIDASASSNPVALGSNATLSATISPAISGVTVSFNVDPGTGVITTYSAVTNNLGVATTSPISGLSVNLYKVVATAGSGCATSNAAYLAVYDPNSSFITGGGWITSPAGALVAQPSLSGKANFGFVAKYKKGNSQVDGNTEFQFQDGDFNFKSSALDAATLVISGSKGTYRGEGTVNGAGDYGFMVAAVDGNISGGGGTDLFRIKIWDRSHGNAVVYDNNMGKDENGVPTTILGGGSIVIHYAKGINSRIMNNGSNVEIANSNSIELTGTGELTVKTMPNPTSYYFTLGLKSLSKEKIMLTVTDIAGRVIEQRTDIPANSTIQLGDRYYPGVYIAEFLQGNDKVTTRLIKEGK